MSIEADIEHAIVAPAARPRSIQIEAAVVFAVLGLAVLCASSLLIATFSLPWALTAAAATSFILVAVFALPTLRHHGFPRFGLANTITTLRAAMTALLAGAVMSVDLEAGGDALTWTLAALAFAALLLDGIDGAVARRAKQVSAYGARYDMEIDALLILCLSAMAFMLGKAGWWVLAIGLMRYAFVAAALFIPRLASRLPESLRRKTICVVQVGVLCLIVLPPVSAAIADPLAFAALALLAISFAIDIGKLLQADPAHA